MQARVSRFALSFQCAVSAVALTACGGSPGETIGTSSAAITFPNDETSYDYFIGKGLTPVQAAGIVGNLDQESGDDPGAVQSGGPGRGIAQWSVGGRWDTDASDNAAWYAGAHGQNVETLDLQLDFVWYELTTFSTYGLAALRTKTNVTDATTTFETDFEGCGECDSTKRITYAQNVLAAFGAATTPEYAAEWVAQSFPLATTALAMTQNQSVAAWIEMKNVGTKTWNSNTRLATTEPENSASVFAAPGWVATDRPAQVSGSVAPGDTYKFAFNLLAPEDKLGTVDQYFGMVQDGVTWFSATGQGGPPDNSLEVKITLGAAAYQGKYISQTYPGAPTVYTMHTGEVSSGSMTIKNTGTKAWVVGTTKLAPIPRDTASPFATSTWLSQTRVSSVTGDVQPGDTGVFELPLNAPAVGAYTLKLGLVEEGVGWFADGPEGAGPPDGLLRVDIKVVADDAGTVKDGGIVVIDDAAPPADGAVFIDSSADALRAFDASGTTEGGNTGDDGGGIVIDAGLPTNGGGESDASRTPATTDATDVDGGTGDTSPGSSGGCSVAPSTFSDLPVFAVLGIPAAIRRRRDRKTTVARRGLGRARAVRSR